MERKQPLVYVYLQTDKDISANEVRLVEEYLNKRINQEFNLVLYVIPVRKISGEENDLPTPESQPNVNINIPISQPQNMDYLDLSPNIISEQDKQKID